MAVAYPQAVEETKAIERIAAPPLPSGSIQPEAVPEAQTRQPVPLVRIIIPVVMVLAMVGMVALMLTGDRQLNPMMLLFPLMMGASMLAMFMPQGGDDTDETRRTYLRHLSHIRRAALNNAAAQRAHELHRHPDPKALYSAASSPRLWERSLGDPDVGEIRIGLGTTALCTPIELHTINATEDLDPVCAVALRHVVTAVDAVPAMPLVVQVGSFSVLSLHGEKARGLARAIIAQLVFHHGPEAMGIEVLSGPRPKATAAHNSEQHTAQSDSTRSAEAAAENEWQWLKWLPHTRTPSEAACRVLIVDVDDSEQPAHVVGSTRWDLIIAIDVHPATPLYEAAYNDGLILRAGANLEVVIVGGDETIGLPDTLSIAEATSLAKALHPYDRPERHNTGVSGELLPLLGYHELEHLRAETLWAPRAPGDPTRLNVPIGVGSDGQPLLLDIKESAHGGVGPHGLCIGATGSGKSELLRTLVVSLALSHSPAELNFVLVDFKGGATFLGLDGLPHTSAVITNLNDEAELVERMSDAISGEMNRRQEVLRAAGNVPNVDAFNAAAAANGTEPMPALVIVIDEFSELLGQHPDFADLFAAVGRLGRSLHIHLLLASQRLEEGRLRGLDSHLSYRIGLRTFSAMESCQVLGVPDAYELPNQPGRGFIKSDAAQVRGFQASYVSGPVSASTGSGGDAIMRVGRFDTRADTVPERGLPSASASEEHTGSAAQSLVDLTVEITTARAAQLGMSAHKVWLDPLPAAIPLGGVVEDIGELRAPVGVIDRPYEQRQDPFVVDFNGQNGHLAVCGGPQTGKTTMLRSIATALASTHSTTTLRFYALDLGGGGLASLDRLPHTAGVAGRENEETIARVVDEVLGFIDEPEQRHTFLLIDGWQALTTDFEELTPGLQRIASEGLAARVHLVIATSRWTALRPSVRDLIGQRYELRLPEPMDSVIDRRRQEKLPALPGRGLNAVGENILIAQSSAQDIAHVARQSEDAGMVAVPALKTLPHHLPATSLPTSDEVVLGVGGSRLEPVVVDFTDTQHLVALGNKGCGKSQLLRVVGRQLAQLPREQARLLVIDHRRRHLGAFEEEMLAGYSGAAETSRNLISELCTTLSQRLPSEDITPQQLLQRSWWSGPELYVLIDDAELLPPGLVNPLAPLIPHAADIGLHVIYARKSGGASRAFYSPGLAEIKDSSPMMLLFDADKDEGPLFGAKPTPLPPGRAQLIRGGTSEGLIQMVSD
ncbi:ESX-1 secretion system protein EccCa1 [Corynebacterium ciconiae DSM 44920]|uniref:type VII secretion protein EccCa n=1 Tax=Corynebacterium ciconiae TaxID=227319 RepID=UPI000362D386|nr:type VII secretion protein EccCa [Corynebacterium ciconiae]WKD60414.1 ESX-1 secretion system protein EccCa1 [Corynebacterium ciconiae DSM 44920]